MPGVLAQFVGLFILSRDRMYWTYIQYTLYVQFFMLGYMAFLVWLMCIAVRMVRTSITRSLRMGTLLTTRVPVRTVFGDHRAAVYPDLLALSSASSGGGPVGHVAGEASQQRRRRGRFSLLPRATVHFDLCLLHRGSDGGG